MPPHTAPPPADTKRRRDPARRPHRSQPPPTPRKRGAQPGNSNAVRHGLYSAHLTDEALAALAEALALSPTDLTREVALARAHLDALLAHGGLEAHSVRLAVEIVARVATRHYRMSPASTATLADAITATLNQLSEQLTPPT